MKWIKMHPLPVTILVVLTAVFLAGCRTSTPLQVALYDPVQLVDRNHDVNGVRLNLPYGRNRNLRGLDVGVFNRVDNQVVGIQASLLSCVAEDLTGMQVSAGVVTVNYAERVRGAQISFGVNPAFWTSGANIGNEVSGFQIATFGNFVSTNANSRLTGGQIALLGVNQSWGDSKGFQCVFFGGNMAKRMTGIQFGPMVINAARDHFAGLQIGAMNQAGEWHWPRCGCRKDAIGGIDGIQIGMFNYAAEVKGVQVGLINHCLRLSGVQIGAINISSDHKWPCIPLINARF